MCTVRVPTSMTVNAYSLVSTTVSMWEKSAASSPEA
jgi:hypothetical protein